MTFHAEQGGYDVDLRSDKYVRTPKDTPELFRYQIQGRWQPNSSRCAFGGPIPETRFFHPSLVSLDGVSFRALRHGMAGQPGFEFIGDYKDAPGGEGRLEKAGEPLGLVHVGAIAYPTAQTESGWIPAPTPGIYSDPRHLEYRKWLSTIHTGRTATAAWLVLLGEHRGLLPQPVSVRLRALDLVQPRLHRS